MNQIKKTILFVDDDPLIIRGFKRSSLEYQKSWDVYFCTSASEALDFLSHHRVEFLITDIRLPGIDGVELLNKISQHYPQIVRFVISGHSDNQRVLHSTRTAHQYISKPVDMNLLWQTIERSSRLRDLLEDKQLLRIITGIKRLPSLPNLYLQLVSEIQSSNPTPKTIGDIIAKDVTMTAKILQLVNSASFSLQKKVTNPQKAVTILGINTIKALVLSIHVFSEFQGSLTNLLNIDELWRHSIMVGDLCREIARNTSMDAQMQEDAQVLGVLHDIGKLIQLKIPNFYSELKVAIYKGTKWLDGEYQILGVSHAEIGAYLLGIWGLPDPIVEGVCFHHTPQKIVNPYFDVTAIVHVADGLYHYEASVEKKPLTDYLDFSYLGKIKVLDKLDTWADICKRIVQQQSRRN
jgi:HD-like signal output (HDOD) protein/CheY-like chemotaxis protein